MLSLRFLGGTPIIELIRDPLNAGKRRQIKTSLYKYKKH